MAEEGMTWLTLKKRLRKKIQGAENKRILSL
jgi:hypothetical protein